MRVCVSIEKWGDKCHAMHEPELFLSKKEYVNENDTVTRWMLPCVCFDTFTNNHATIQKEIRNDSEWLHGWNFAVSHQTLASLAFREMIWICCFLLKQRKNLIIHRNWRLNATTHKRRCSMKLHANWKLLFLICIDVAPLRVTFNEN